MRQSSVLEEHGSHDEAIDVIKTALRLGPDSWEANREAGRLMFRQRRLAEAAAFFNKATSLMDSDYNDAAMLFCCYQALGDTENKLRAASILLDRTERAFARDSADAYAAAYGTAALAALGEEQRAKEWMERALLLDPNNLGIRYILACGLASVLNDAETAVEVLEPFFESINSLTHIKHLEADPDLHTIREHPRFKEMLRSAKVRLGIATETGR